MFPRLIPCCKCGKYHPVQVTTEQNQKISDFIKSGDVELIEFLEQKEFNLVVHNICWECNVDEALPTEEDLIEAVIIGSL